MSASYIEDDQSVRARMQRRITADNYRAQNLSVQQAAAFASYSAAYPTADPSVIVPLAQTGLPVNDPRIQKIMLQHTVHQQKGGWFNKIGDVVGGAVHEAGKGLGFVAGSTGSGLAALGKGAVRSAVIAVETPFQEIQDFSRAALYTGLNRSGGHDLSGFSQSLGSALQESGSSSGVEVLSKIASGDLDKIDLGTGFIPGGKIEEEVKRKAGRLQLSFGKGEFGGPGRPAITLGRIIGATVAEPGTKPFRILSGLADAAVAWYGDPVAALGSAAHEGEAGARLSRGLGAAWDEGLGAGVRELANKPTLATIHANTTQGLAARQAVHTLLGMIPGHRPTTIPEVTAGWLAKGAGPITEKLAAETDPLTIYRAMNKSFADPNVPIAIANEFAQARTPQEVAEILRTHLGPDIAQTPEYLGFRVKAMGEPGVRMLGMMPGSSVDPTNLEDVFNGVDRLLRSGKIAPEVRNEALRQVMAIPDAPSVAPALIDIMHSAAQDLAPRLRVAAVGSAEDKAALQAMKANNLFRMYAEPGNKLRAYLSDEIIANDKAAGLAVDGTLIPAQKPYQTLEWLNSTIPLPSAREIRTATATLGRLVDNPVFKTTTGYADTLMSYWKPLTIIKPALTTRLVGEHGAEMAGMGLDSIWSHQLSYVAALVSNPKLSQEFLESAREHPTEVLKHPFKTTGALAAKATAPFRGKIRQGNVLGERFFNEKGETALKGLLASMGNDAMDLAGVASNSIRGHTLYSMADGPAFTKAWHSSLSAINADDVWRKVAESRGNLEDVERWLWGEGQGFRVDLAKRLPLLKSPEGVHEYVQSLYRGAMYRTGGDPLTLDAIASGLFDGERMGGLDAKGEWRLSDAFKKHLENVTPPESVKGSITFGGPHPKAGYFDDVMTYLFDHLLQEPFEYLVNSPSVRQNYWNRAEQMLPFMDDTRRAAVLENAAKEAIGPGKAQLARMRSVTEGTGQITNLDDVHGLALKYALNETKKVLYDLHNKSQFFDAMRTVFPFGEAWRQAMKRWGKIAWNNPNVLVGGQKIVTGARGSGFFHKDERGDEVFNMPFARNISKLELGLVTALQGGSSHGAAVDMTSPVSGLSMMSDILPGVGPVLQVGAGAILPDTPDWEWAKRFISPRGEQDYSQGVLESSLPGFAKSLMQVMQAGNPRQFAGAVSDASNYLVSTGDYDMTDPTGAEQRRMLDDAKAIAKGTFVLKAVGQTIAPSSPTPQALAKVKDGRLLEQALIAQQFNKWVADPKVGYDGAISRFLDRFGAQAFLSTQGKTMALTSRLPLSGASSAWEKAHPGVVKDYNLVWGLFAPEGTEGDFDYGAYKRQLERGDRVPVTPAQRLALAQNHIAAHIYAVKQAQMPDKPSPEQRDWLAQVRQTLMEEYPSYRYDIPGLPAKVSPDKVVAQLARAVVDPRLSRTPEAKAASIYLQKRQEAIAAARTMGATSWNGTALGVTEAAPLRAWLANIGAVLSNRTPGFGPFFDAVFSKELT